MNPNNNGEILETPADSPSGITTTDTSVTDNPQGAEPTETPEEVEFNSLKGSTQDRIKTLIQERDAERAKAERLNQYISSANNNQPQQPAMTDPYNPQVRDAVAQLSKVGIATKDEVNQQINQSIGQMVYNFELEKLSNKYDGSNGLPKFERSEYEDYVARNPKYQGYDPEDVYQKMYSEEIMDAKLNSRGVQPKSQNSSLRPNRTQVREEQWTPESINERLKAPDGKEWYVKNTALVNKVMSQPQE